MLLLSTASRIENRLYDNALSKIGAFVKRDKLWDPVKVFAADVRKMVVDSRRNLQRSP